MEHEKPRPERAPEPKDDARVVAHRCPFCHEAVRPDAEAWVACAQCLGRQHAACWDESGRCGACAHERHLELPGAGRGRRPALAPLVVLFLALLVVGWTAGAVLLTPSPRGGDGIRVERPVVVPLPPPDTEVAGPSAVDAGDLDEHVEPLARPVVPPSPSVTFDDLLQRPASEVLAGRGTPDERFDWVPEHLEPEELRAAWRIVDTSRERLRERPSEVASLVIDAHEADRLIGDHAGAIALCDRAIRLDPLYGAAWTARGWAWLRAGNHSNAVLDLRQGAQLSHDPTWAWIGLGRWAEHEGDTTAALKAYREALRLGGARSGTVDHEADLRARIERLSATRPR